jgi:hypothetical protein
MFDVMNYADRNDVEVSIRKGHDGRTAWEIFLRDRNLGLTEFTRIIDIEIRGRLDQDAYLTLRCEEMMDRIRSARMKIEYADIEMKKEESVQQPSAAVQIPLLFVNIYCMALSKKAAAL